MGIYTILAQNGSGTTAPLTLTFAPSYGIVGTPFAGQFTPSGGVAPYTFLILTGGLPTGLTLETATGTPNPSYSAGQVYGTPTEAQNQVPYNVQVTDSASNTATTTGTITIFPSSTGPFADVVTGLSIAVVYSKNINGGYQFQVPGNFVPPLVGSALTISAITNANPGKATTSTAHGWSTGQYVWVIATMTGSSFPTAVQITVTSTTQFTIGINTSSWGAYSGGGTAQQVDPSYAYSIAGLLQYPDIQSSVNPGAPLAANVAPALCNWTGPFINVPTTSTTFWVFVICIQINSLNQSITATYSSTVTVSLALAQAALGGSSTAPVANGTLTSATPYYPTIGPDGIEFVQFNFTGTVPTNSDIEGMGLVLCPLLYFEGYGSVGTLLPSESSGYGGGSINVFVKPWYQTGLTCTVANLSGTNYASATFTISGGTIAPGIANNYCLINNLLCYIPQNGWLTPTTFTITTVQGGTLGNGSFSFAGQEARYGIAIGDTISNGNESFVFTGLQAGYAAIGTLLLVSGVWVSGWVFTRSAGAHPSYASGGLLASIESSSETAGLQLGFMAQGQTVATSGTYRIGAPTAYIAYGVMLSSVNAYNPWPIAGVTPFAIVGTVEVQTPGSISGNRLAVDTLHPTLTTITGTLGSTLSGPNLATNGFLTYGTLGQAPPGWNTSGPNYPSAFQGGIGNGSWYFASVGGLNALVAIGNGGIAPTMVSCNPGQQFGATLQAFAFSATNVGATLRCIVGFANSAGVFIGSGYAEVDFVVTASNTGAFYRVPISANTLITATAPSTAAYVFIGFIVQGLTVAGNSAFAIAAVTLEVLTTAAGIQLTGPLGPDASGANLTVTQNAINNQYMAANAIENAQLAIDAVEAANISSGAAASNVNAVVNSLNANTIDATNGIIVNLTALNATVADQIVSQSIVLTSGAYTITLNSGGTALTIYNSITASTINLTNGTISITQGTSTTVMEVTSTPLSGPSVQVQNGNFIALLNVDPGVGATVGAFNNLTNFGTLFVNGTDTGLFLSGSALGSWTPANNTLAVSDGTGGYTLGLLYIMRGGTWQLP